MYVKPGMEGMLALSIAQVIIADGLADAGAADALTAGFDINAFSPEAVASSTRVSAEKIRTVAPTLRVIGLRLRSAAGRRRRIRMDCST